MMIFRAFLTDIDLPCRFVFTMKKPSPKGKAAAQRKSYRTERRPELCCDEKTTRIFLFAFNMFSFGNPINRSDGNASRIQDKKL